MITGSFKEDFDALRNFYRETSRLTGEVKALVFGMEIPEDIEKLTRAITFSEEPASHSVDCVGGREGLCTTSKEAEDALAVLMDYLLEKGLIKSDTSVESFTMSRLDRTFHFNDTLRLQAWFWLMERRGKIQGGEVRTYVDRNGNIRHEVFYEHGSTWKRLP